MTCHGVRTHQRDLDHRRPDLPRDGRCSTRASARPSTPACRCPASAARPRPRSSRSSAAAFRLALAQYRELAAFAQFASDLDEATRKQLERGQRVTELLKQPQYAPLSVAEMGVILFAADNRGFCDDVDIRKNRATSKKRCLIDHIKTTTQS